MAEGDAHAAAIEWGCGSLNQSCCADAGFSLPRGCSLPSPFLSPALLQGKLGSKLPQDAAARCLHLASWEHLEEGQAPASGTPIESSLLQQLQLAALDPAAPAGAAPPPATAGWLAELAAASGQGRQLQQRMRLQLQLPAEQLLEAAAGCMRGRQQLRTLFSACQGAEDTAAVARFSPQALPALLQLVCKAAVPEEQRGLLLLAAALAASATGNSACAQRLLARAEVLLPDIIMGSCQPAGQLMLRQLNLQAEPAAGSSEEPLQLLLAARSGGGAASRAVVQAAAQMLLAPAQQAQPQAAAQLAGLVQACQLPGLSTGGSASIATLEQQLLAGQLGSQQADTLQYAALKAAVAAAPGSASLWWQWAGWLSGLQEQQHQLATGAAAAAGAAAFTASCRALALAGPSGGYGSLPALLSVLQQLMEQGGSSPSLPADAAEQLAAVPAGAWLPILPLLLSCLAGSGEVAPSQQLLLGLLLHVGAAEPCQVLLPALVAAQAHGAAPPAAAGLPPAPAALAQLLDALKQRHPELAQQLLVLTAEAARLAVLPEEHWHTVLQEAAATAARRLQQQQQQQRGAAAGDGEGAAASGAAEAAHFAALAPVLLCLRQQLEAAEAAAPQTPHEQRFHQLVLPKLRALVQQLAEPPAAQTGGPDAQQQQQPQAVALLRAAAAEMGAGLRQRQLVLADVAPALASLAGTRIPIPGAAVGPDGAPELAGVAADVAVLATKTRPKRLRFLGSDGAEHAFLLKVGWGQGGTGCG